LRDTEYSGLGDFTAISSSKSNFGFNTIASITLFKSNLTSHRIIAKPRMSEHEKSSLRSTVIFDSDLESDLQQRTPISGSLFRWRSLVLLAVVAGTYITVRAPDLSTSLDKALRHGPHKSCTTTSSLEEFDWYAVSNQYPCILVTSVIICIPIPAVPCRCLLPYYYYTYLLNCI
jgi:hypothetical protein